MSKKNSLKAKEMKVQKVFDQLTLYTTADKFYVEPADRSSILVIDRVTEAIECQPYAGQIPQSSGRRQIHGILGVVKLIASPYLIVVTSRKKIGQISNCDIYQVESTELIQYARSQIHLNETQARVNAEYVSMLESVLQTPSFYFSYDYDLSNTVQRLHHTSPQFLSTPMHIRADPRFLWNQFLLSELYKSESIAPFCLPIIHGFISINTCVVNGRTFQLTLISRRSKARAGSRLFVRGVDSDGNVANFVETEQIVETSSDRASFVQIRGSIPLYWQQWPNLKLRPRPSLIYGENHLDAFNKHFSSLIQEYGRQVVVNLIDQKGSEGKIEDELKNIFTTANNRDLKYEAFDFHKECSKMRWDRLKILIDRLDQDQQEMGVMMTIGDGKVVSEQDGVFRTNCIDCLDRTNVVQSMFARKSLDYVLHRLGILTAGQSVADQIGLETLFKNIWADNADAISVQYSGSGALKTDYTRTGKRTRHGVIQDLINGLTRYLKNNFSHGRYQDGIDLFLGKYKVNPNEGSTTPSPLESERDWKYTTFPLVLLVAIAMFCANVIAPTDYTTANLLCLLFWGTMVFSTLSTIFYYSHEFIDSPRLLKIGPNLSPHNTRA